MRIHLKIRSSKELVSFNHQQLLTGTIHKWIGWNEEHGNVTLHSFSRLEGGKIRDSGILFENGASFFFSSHDLSLSKRIIAGIQRDPKMFEGLVVSEIIIEEDPDLTNRDYFMVASPIFLKRKEGSRVDHILYDDPRANDCLKETLQTRIKKAGIVCEDFEIKFDNTYAKAGTKKITYNGIQNRASWCPVIIIGNSDIKQFAWNVGLGNSTGIGFGAIK